MNPRLLAGIALAAIAVTAQAASVSKLIGEPLRNEQGKIVGALSDLIIDVKEARVVYLIVEGRERFHTLPIRALGADKRLDMSLAGALATFDSPADVRFRRAVRLLGQTVTHPHPGKIVQLGVISDIEFDAASGQVSRVVVESDAGKSGFPPGVLMGGRFPPLTHWQKDYIDTEDLDTLGYVRREPSSERLRLHDHQW
jgi:sporulation protein YlmC with PRC-barrel domain